MKRNKRATGRAILDWLSRNPLPENVRRSAEEIDAAIEEERRSWDSPAPRTSDPPDAAQGETGRS